MQCEATVKRTGQRCRRDAIAGGNVCIKHGGAAPQVKAAAKLRLAALVDPAIGVLAATMRERKKDTQAAVRAAIAVLDRTGHGPTLRTELTGADGGPIETNVSPRELLTRKMAELASQPGSDHSEPDGSGS